MELLKPDDIVPYLEPLFKRIAKCIASTNILVGTGSLCHIDRGKDALSVEQPGVLHHHCRKRGEPSGHSASSI